MSSELTKIFKEVGEIDGKKESLGAQCVAYLVKHKCWTADLAEVQFAKSYEENGWSMAVGRPAAGSTLTAAPPTVKNYITALRGMYDFALDIRSYTTMGEIRKAVREARAAKRETLEKPAALVGVQVSKEGVLTGGLIHDISVVLTHMPDEDRPEFEAKLRRALASCMKKSTAELRLVA